MRVIVSPVAFTWIVIFSDSRICTKEPGKYRFLIDGWISLRPLRFPKQIRRFILQLSIHSAMSIGSPRLP
jgi:hypothetical protein